MSDVTHEQKYYKTQNILLIISFAGAVVLAFILFNKCGSEKAASIAYDKIKDTLQKIISKEASVRAEAKSWKDGYDKQELLIADLVADRDMMQGALIDKTDEAERLSVKLKNAKVNNDTPSFYLHCDSISIAFAIQTKWVENLRMKNEQIEALRIDQTNKLKGERDLWEKNYNECLGAVKSVDTLIVQLKPKAQFFVIAGAFVYGPINGISGGIQYKTANGIVIGGKGVFSNYGAGVLIEFGVPLNFRRNGR